MQLLSNAVQRQFYNRNNTVMAGTHATVAQGVVHRYDYLVTQGTISDDFVGRIIPNSILKYDFQKNEYLNWSFAHFPQSWHSYRDKDNNQQLLFGAAGGQVYQMSGTATSDAGQPIASEMIFVFTYDQPEYEKKWNFFRAIFNPGCQAKVQFACANTYQNEFLKWTDFGNVTNGIMEYRFPDGSQSRLLFIRIYESSKDAKWIYYGCSIDAAVKVKV